MKRIWPAVVVCMGIFCGAAVCYGWVSEIFGPLSDQPHPISLRRGLPANIAVMLQHESRVYSRNLNGSEAVYFKANSNEIHRLIELFSLATLRDHELWIREDSPRVESIDKRNFEYNAYLYVTGEIARTIGQLSGEGHKSHDPKLWIFIARDEVEKLIESMELPSNIILHNEIPGSTMTGRATKPHRDVWHAKVVCDDPRPVSDPRDRTRAEVTLWSHGAVEGIGLGRARIDGSFQAPFSDREIADLKAGNLWLTVTVGDRFSRVTKDDPRLNVKHLVRDRVEAQPVIIAHGPREWNWLAPHLQR
jgi:hypothetical protein